MKRDRLIRLTANLAVVAGGCGMAAKVNVGIGAAMIAAGLFFIYESEVSGG